MDPNRPLGIKSEPDEPPKIMTIPQATTQATPAAQSAFTAATFAASDSITVATTPAAATTSTATAAAKATPAKKATATPRKPAAAKKEAAVKTPAVPKTAAAAAKATPKATPKATAKATPKATAKATPKTAAAKATPTTNTAAGAAAAAGVTPTTAARSTGTGTSTGRPRGRPKKNATDAATTTGAAAAANANGSASASASANKNTNATGNAASSSPVPVSAAASSPVIVATANRPAANRPANRPAAARQATNNARGRGGSAASSSTTPAKRTASAASGRGSVEGDGRASKQRKVSGTGTSGTSGASGASGAASASKPGAKAVAKAAASGASGAVGGVGGAGGARGAGGAGTAASGTGVATGVAKKGWSVDGNEINRRHKENDLHLLETGEFSDATIHCLKKKWKVHKMRLSTRSAWFKEAFAGSDGTGQISEINLHEQNADDIETMLRFMYADSLDDNLTHPSSLPTPITTYVTLYNLGHTFSIPLLCRDSLTLLGQYLDTKLLLLCTYSVPASGRSGVIDHSDPLLSPSSYSQDLFSAIFQAYSGVNQSTKLHSLLASFIWAGRDRLFRLPGLRQLVDQVPMLGTDVFKLLLGDNSSSFIPPTTIKLTNLPGGSDIDELKSKHFGPTCSRLDHTRKTQHPDRCEHCDEVFDEERWAKRVFNPFKVVVRPAAWCRRCVEGKALKTNLDMNAPGGGGGARGGRGGIGGVFELGVGGPVVLEGDGDGRGGNGEGGNGQGGEGRVVKGPLEDVVPMWRLSLGGDDE